MVDGLMIVLGFILFLVLAACLIKVIDFKLETPLPPSTDWSETVSSDEAEAIQGSLDSIADMQALGAKESGGVIRRCFHAKSHQAMLGEFRVLDDVPAAARHGLFANPGTYKAWVRFSNGHFLVRPDREPDARGLAIKILGAPGPMLIEEPKGATTQDILTTNSPTNLARNIPQYIAFTRSAMAGGGAVGVLLKAVGLRETLRILWYVVTQVLPPTRSLLSLQYYTGGTLMLGAYAARFKLTPEPMAKAPLQLFGPPDFLRDDLTRRLKTGDVRLNFFVQFYVDPVHTPIEDASVPWSEAISPPARIGELILSKRDLDSAASRAENIFGNELSFTPWHGSKELRPLGCIMRVRRQAYEASASRRGFKPEPDGSETLDPV